MALATVLGVPEQERDAFVRFARAGWADEPPANPRPDLERPWLVTLENAAAGAVTTRAAPRSLAPTFTHVESNLIARDDELTRLRDALDGTLEGSGTVVLIAGEAGQGKTALMTAFAARAQLDHPDLVTAAGSCNAFTGTGDPFLPFRQLLRQLTGDVPHVQAIEPLELARVGRLQDFAVTGGLVLLTEGPHLLDSFVPGEALRVRLAEASVASGAAWASARTMLDAHRNAVSGADAPEALRAEVTSVLTRMARHAPLLLLLDDLQWADRSSLDLLLQLARATPEHRILVVAAFRPEELAARNGSVHPLASLVAELERQLGEVVLDLDRGDGRAFLEGLLDSEPNALGPAFRRALWQQTAGQPLFTIELLRAMQERGDIVRDGDGRWVEAATVRWDALPAKVAGALRVRFDRLSAEEQSVLRVAAVEGGVFTAEVVARILGREPVHVLHTLGEALGRAHGLVQPDALERGSEGPISRYRFRHDLIQRFVFEVLDAGERRHLHEAVADATVSLRGDDADPVAVALHYTLAGAPGRAAPFQRHAGDRARRSGALVDAIDHYRAALDHDAALDARGRAELLRDLGECLWMRGDLEDAERALKEASTAFEALGDGATAGAAYLALGRAIFSTEARFGRSKAVFDRALELLEAGPESAALARAYAVMALHHLILSEEAEALRWGERALDLAERLGADGVRPAAMMAVGDALAILGGERREEGIAMMVEAFDAAEGLGLAVDASFAKLVLAAVLEGLGRNEEALEQWLLHLEHARHHHISGREGLARLMLLNFRWRRGAWERSFGEVAFARADGIEHARSAFHVAGIDLDLGRVAEAQAGVAPHSHRVRDDVELHVAATMLKELLRLSAALGDAEGADGYATRLVRICAARTSCPYDAVTPLLFALEWLAGRPQEDARDLARTCLAVLAAAERQWGSPEARAALSQGRAALARAEGDLEGATEALLRAAEQWRAAAFPLDEARALSRAAPALVELGRWEEAKAARARAQSLLSALAAQIPDRPVAASFARVSEELLQAR